MRIRYQRMRKCHLNDYRAIVQIRVTFKLIVQFLFVCSGNHAGDTLQFCTRSPCGGAEPIIGSVSRMTVVNKTSQPLLEHGRNEKSFRAWVYPAPYLDDTRRDTRWVKRSCFDRCYDFVWTDKLRHGAVGRGVPMRSQAGRISRRRRRQRGRWGT